MATISITPENFEHVFQVLANGVRKADYRRETAGPSEIEFFLKVETQLKMALDAVFQAGYDPGITRGILAIYDIHYCYAPSFVLKQNLKDDFHLLLQTDLWDWFTEVYLHAAG